MGQELRIPGTVAVRGTAKANEKAVADLAAEDPPERAKAELARLLEEGGENAVHARTDAADHPGDCH